MLAAITLMTFNFWGLPNIGTVAPSLVKHEREVALCSKLTALASSNAVDVVALQEVWDPADRDALKNCGYPVSVDLNDPARLVDSGLLILSRYPLASTAPIRVKYPKPDSNGLPSFDGETLADKSVIVARFSLPDGRTFVVGDTHLISFYTHYPQYDPYETLRFQEMHTAVNTVSAYRSSPGEPAFLLGDFNTGAIVDGRPNPSWTDLTSGLSYDSTQDVTCTTCKINPFTDENDVRMDYVFALANPSVKALGEVRALDHPETINASGLSAYLSDHFGWTARYQF